MPAIRGTYWKHPFTDEPGYWIMLMDGSIVGISETQIKVVIPKSGSAAAKRAGLRTAMIDILQPMTEKRTPLANWSAEDQAALIANPEPFCRIDGTDYVARESIIEVVVSGLNPLSFNVTISNGASGVQTSYG